MSPLLYNQPWVITMTTKEYLKLIDEVNEKYADLLDNGPYKIEWASAWKINDIEQKLDIEAAQNAAEAADAGDGDTTIPADDKGGANNETD